MEKEINLADIQRDSLKPLTETRSAADIEAGGETLQERAERVLGLENSNLFVPRHLEEVTRKNGELHGIERTVNEASESIILNPAAVPEKGLEKDLESLESGEKLVHGDTLVALNPSKEVSKLEEVSEEAERCGEKETEEVLCVIEYIWDIVEKTPELVQEFFPGGEINGEIHESASIEGREENLYLGEGAEISADAHIDVSEGPVYIGSETRIFPGSRVTGPTFIGPETKVGAGQNAVIHEGTHIGKVCRAGGEIEEATVHSFTNKYHYGYLGHAVVGSWVNFGAGTTNSDLKNTYGDVKVTHPEEGEINVGQFMGSMIGDFSKFGISTRIHTGKIIGPACFITGTLETDLEALTWYQDGQESNYRPEDAGEHQVRMMNRREEYLPEGFRKAYRKLIEDLTE